MIKKLVAAFFASINLIALELHDFHGEFVQKVGQEISYRGEIYLNREPLNILWIYKKPILKKIYVSSGKTVVVEPRIEQVTVSKRDSGKNLIQILKNAKKIDKGIYRAHYEDTEYTIWVDKRDLPTKITFTDKFEKPVVIEFINIKPQKSDRKIFIPKYEKSFDLVEVR